MGFLREKVRARFASRAEVEALREQVQRLRERTRGLDKLRQGVRKHGRRLDRQRATINRLRGRIENQSRRTEVLRTDFQRMGQQLAVTETRIEQLRERLDPERYDATPEDQVEARRLVDEIRREHEQIRVRFQVVSNYEERLSRVEDALRAQHAENV